VLLRRIVVLALLGLIACLAVGLGPAMVGDDAGQAITSVASVAPATARPAPAHDDGDRAAPCVVRADCAGGLGLVTVALLPVVALAAAVSGPIATPATRVISRRVSLRSRLSADRLLRPPQA
jgi:hypothetical protein